MSEKIPAIGSLRERIQLLNKVMSDDGAGGHVVSFVLLATVWAKVNPAKGRVFFEADSRGAIASYEILIRYRSDLNIGDQIIYRDEKLEVISADDLNGRKAYIKCICNKKTVAG